MDNEELKILIEQIRYELDVQMQSNYRQFLQLWDQVHGSNLVQYWDRRMHADDLTEKDLSKEEWKS